MSKKVFFLLRSSNEKDVLDGLRSTLGLSVGNHFSNAVVMHTELAPFDDYNKENLEWIRDMEGEVYSTVQANVDKNELTPTTLEEVGQKLRDMDFIVPYGTQD
jgi:hypothetical protein